MTEVIQMNKEMERIFNALHRSVSNVDELYKPFLYFTPCGKQRLLSIYGWIVGLHNAGQIEFANNAAANLQEKLDYLSHNQWQEITTKEEWSGVVPARRVLIGDDRCFNSFSFVVCMPRLDDANDDNTIKDLDYEMYSQGNYFSKKQIKYRAVYNGGLIYHGPFSGNTFTTNFGGEKLWGIHT